MQFTKRDIVDLLLNNTNNIDLVIKAITSKQDFDVESIEDDQLCHLRASISTLRTKYKPKFEQVGRKRDPTYKQFADWLHTGFEVPDFHIKEKENKSWSSPSVSRSRIDFKTKSTRSQRRQALEINTKHNHDASKLIAASIYAAKCSGEKDLSAILKECLEKSDTANKITKYFIYERNKYN